MDATIIDIKGKETGKVALPGFFETKVSPALMHEVIVGYLANQRAGTHSTKTRAEVSGGGVKPWKQKGTGRARIGSMRSPLVRKGGIAFGPKPRSYNQQLSKKKKKIALSMALSEKAKQNNVRILNAITLDEPKTKKMAQILKDLNVTDKKVLLIVEHLDANLLKASKNLGNLILEEYKTFNVYQVMWAHTVFFTAAAVEQIEQQRNLNKE